ncbi:MAG: hypothetical protein PVF70_08780 [Anaerolineales bacterium]|jgi:hypothetical protein
MKPTSISAINNLSQADKEEIYGRFLPRVLLERFRISPAFTDGRGRALLKIQGEPGRSDVVIELRHEVDAVDPLLYAHLTDTPNGQIHVLLYVVNDPDSPRFDVDRMPDGSPTKFGILDRNLEAELAAMQAGLAPGQVRSGMRILRHSIEAFEDFVGSVGHDLYLVEPLAYHNAVVFERYGFSYLKGRRLMQRIHQGFRPGGDLYQLLDGTSPFRQPWMCNSIRGRSWAIHDGILGTPFSHVTIYKRVGIAGDESTYPDAVW